MQIANAGGGGIPTKEGVRWNRTKIQFQKFTWTTLISKLSKPMSTRSLGALRPPTSRLEVLWASWLVLCALLVLMLFDPCNIDWIVGFPLESVLACGFCVKGSSERDGGRPILGVWMTRNLLACCSIFPPVFPSRWVEFVVLIYRQNYLIGQILN